mmetsp:Transcript_125658/g.355442  ORF Transcript_125658/g.355442 Transcript_125658/m.355442 type:complete len:532 (+) Transcript_125658:105-1700(+)
MTTGWGLIFLSAVLPADIAAPDSHHVEVEVAVARANATSGASATADAVKGGETQDCWGGSFSFELCCRIYVEGVLGNPSCWVAGFTYGRCCAPELRPRILHGLRFIDEGDFRKASHASFDLYTNFASSPDDRTLSYQVFEKAAKEFQKTLDDLPKALSYFEVLFHGLGIECEAREGSNPVDDLYRCCPQWYGPASCDVIFHMIAAALAQRMKRSPGGEDAYYEEFSQHWAFHHYAPSMLLSEHVSDKSSQAAFDRAFHIHGGIAGALAGGGEPPLGIVWAGHAPGHFRSFKFLHGVLSLTLALSTVQRREGATGGGGRAVHLVEIGAGYAALPRLVAAARQRLLGLEPPVDVQSHTVFDVRHSAELQEWYLRKTLGEGADVHRWPPEGRPGVAGPAAVPWRGQGAADAPLRIDLVDQEQRDAFIYTYGQAVGAAAPEVGGGGRPVRVLIAVNSWHEFGMTEYLWYYNTFVTGPAWHMSADYILYVSNREWGSNAQKERMVLEPGRGHDFSVEFEECTEITCTRLLRRAAAA